MLTRHADKLDISLHDSIEILDIHEFDRSMNVALKNKSKVVLSWEVSHNLLVL